MAKEESTLIECPECEARLKVKTAPTPGRKVKCPKCAAQFVPRIVEEEPAAPVRSTPARPKRPVEDDLDEEAPRKSAARSDRGRKRDEEDPDRDDDRDDDRERRRSKRDRDEEEDDREERRRPRPKKRPSKSNAGFYLVLGLSIGGGVLLIGGLVTLLVVFGLGSKHERAMREMIGVVNDLSTDLESVKDASTAKAAAPRIERSGQRLEKLMERVREMGDPSKEEQQRLEKKYKDDLMKAMSRFLNATMSAARNSQGDPDLDRAMRGLNRGRFRGF